MESAKPGQLEVVHQGKQIDAGDEPLLEDSIHYILIERPFQLRKKLARQIICQMVALAQNMHRREIDPVKNAPLKQIPSQLAQTV